MRVLLLGGTGMIGQGVLRECLKAPDVESVTALGRSATGQAHPRLREIVREDLFDLGPIEKELGGLDTCFFCLGVSSAGMSEAAYRRVTFDLTLGVARTLARLNPRMTFVYVSGAGTGGRAMWARVKGETETALLELPFRACFMFRPGFIRPMHGIRSRTTAYRVLYGLLGPVSPALGRLFPGAVTTTEKLGRAMLAAARLGEGREILESPAINALADGT